jgi:hypothetical protein
MGDWNSVTAFLLATDNSGRSGSVSAPTPTTPSPVIVSPADGATFTFVQNTAISNITPSVTGGTGPYTWTATGLPAGLSINASTGVISGTPTTPGNASVAITVTDSSFPTALTDTNTFSVTVQSAASLNLVFWGSVANVPGSFTAGQIQALDNNMVSGNSAGGVSKSGRAGTYEFAASPPAPANTFKVIAWPTTYSSGGTLTLMVGGFPWGLNPGDNTMYQTGLIIGGTSYDVFVTSLTANGGFTTSGGNPVIVT